MSSSALVRVKSHVHLTQLSSRYLMKPSANQPRRWGDHQDTKGNGESHLLVRLREQHQRTRSTNKAQVERAVDRTFHQSVLDPPKVAGRKAKNEVSFTFQLLHGESPHPTETTFRNVFLDRPLEACTM